MGIFGSPSLYLSFVPPLVSLLPNDGNVWSRTSCRYVSDGLLAGTGGSVCAIGRKWLMRTRSAEQEMSAVSTRNISRHWQKWRGSGMMPGGTPYCHSLQRCWSPMINRWLFLIDGCLLVDLNTNVRCFWASCVNSGDHYIAAAPLCGAISFIITHQIIAEAIRLHWVSSCCCCWHLVNERITCCWWIQVRNQFAGLFLSFCLYDQWDCMTTNPIL